MKERIRRIWQIIYRLDERVGHQRLKKNLQNLVYRLEQETGHLEVS